MTRFVGAAAVYAIVFLACFTLAYILTGIGIAVIAVPFVGAMILSVSLPVYLVVLLYAVVKAGRESRIIGILVGAGVPPLIFRWITGTQKVSDLFAALVSGGLAAFYSMRVAQAPVIQHGES
jgi:hypothetical protein